MDAHASVGRRVQIGRGAAVGIVLSLWLVYTVLQTLSVVYKVSEIWSAIVDFVPGLLAVGVLLAAGLSREDCYLRVRRLSWVGLAVLAAIAVFALAAVLPFGAWQGWNWLAALVYAPADGIAQELFFRSALLPAMQLALKRERPWLALLLHALLFGLWHIAPLFVGAPLWAVAAVMLVPFLCGIGWGWQVRHDRTVVWAMVQHSLIWVIGLQFPMAE
jgi:membrane protease YdiL (CAAX protease family)